MESDLVKAFHQMDENIRYFFLRQDIHPNWKNSTCNHGQAEFREQPERDQESA